jgi:hypothetical protein
MGGFLEIWWKGLSGGEVSYILRLLNNFKGILKAEFCKGDTILFSHDLWNGQVLKLSFPQLHSYAKSDKGAISLVLQIENFQEHFHLPLLEIAYEQFCELIVLLQSLQVGD